MSVSTSAISDLQASVSTNSTNSSKTVDIASRWIPWILLLSLLLASIPIVVCMPLTSDTVLFDLQARTAIDGGVLYRDAAEPNFPGIVWIHMAVRSVAGWSNQSLRIVDLFIVGLACILLIVAGRQGRQLPRGAIALPWLFMSAFYLSRNEWCHCQRDSWMLLPVSIAVWLRIQHIARQAGSRSFGSMCLILEGIAWGAAVWIKPHVAVSLAAVQLYSLITSDGRKRHLTSEIQVYLGMLLVAIPGITWLIRTGAWSSFLEMQLEWNPEYLQAGAERKSFDRALQMITRFHPWWLLHLLAAPVACLDVARQVMPNPGRFTMPSESKAHFVSGLLAVLYLSWLTQASVIQHAMDYIQVPPVLLGIAFLASREWRLAIELRRLAVSLAFIPAVLASQQLEPSRLSLWTTCLIDGSSSELHQRLAHGNLPNWKDLERVTQYLASQNIQQGDVTSWNVHTIHVYRILNLKPSTRYPCVSILIELFPSRSENIRSSIKNCGQRFVVTNRAEAPVVPDEFPWNLPVVFRSGEIEVHEQTPLP